MGGDIRAEMRDERAHFAWLEAGATVQTADPEGSARHAVAATRPAPTRFVSIWASAGRRIGPAMAAAVEREWARGAGFLCLPVLLGAGALFYFVQPFEPSALALALSAGLLAAATALSGARFALRLSFAAGLAVVLGLGVAKLETWRAGTAMVGSDVTTNLTGRIVRIERQASGRVRYTIDVTGTRRPQLYYPPERVRLTARHLPPGLTPGDGVAGLVRLMSPSGPVRPQSYDFSFQSYFDGIGAVGFFMKGPEPAALAEPSSFSTRLAAALSGLRQQLAERLRGRIGGAEGEVAAALIVGERSGIPEETNEALRRAGLAHVLAISGLHMALVAFTIMGTIRAGFALSPAFSSRYPVKKFAAAAALGAVLVYLFISGAAVAAQRSFLMLAVMLTALFFDRAAITMRNLAITAIIIIVLSPHEVVGPSFQMSFAATAALIAGYAGWSEWRERRLAQSEPPRASVFRALTRGVAVYGGGLILTSLIAGAATTIYGVWHFQRASPLALVGNIAAMPIVSLIVMPSAVAAAVTMPFGLDGWALTVMGKGIAAVVAIASWVAERSPLDATGAIPASAVLLITLGLTILALSTTRLRLIAIPFLMAGASLIATRDLPDAMISEDGRLVAMRLGDGGLAVNRSRPNGFTVENWLRAAGAAGFVKPQPAKEAGSVEASMSKSGESAFRCHEDLCAARHASGAVIVHARDWGRARFYCGTAQLIVIDDATIRPSCRQGSALVLTKRQLARHGSAAVWFDGSSRSKTPRLHLAISEPWRPWHTHRAWSRAARGLPPN